MEIKHDQSYLSENNTLVEAGLANDMIWKICIQGNLKENEYKLIKQIADYLEENFRMYQYKKDNGVKFKTEDLYFWTNEEREKMLYFDVSVKADTPEKHNQIVNSIVKYLEENYSDSQIYVRLQYKRLVNWNKVNEYLKQDFDLNKMPVNVLQLLHNDSNYVGHGLTLESINKLNELSNAYLDQFVDKKVLWNGEIKGTVRKFEEGRYGLFKPRARKTYFPIELGKIKSLVFA